MFASVMCVAPGSGFSGIFASKRIFFTESRINVRRIEDCTVSWNGCSEQYCDKNRNSHILRRDDFSRIFWNLVFKAFLIYFHFLEVHRFGSRS